MAENEQQTPFISLKGQYIKDLSFENPRAPESLMSLTEAPGIEVNVDLAAQRLQENVFELAMRIQAKAKQENQTLFLADLTYAGIFEVNTKDEAHFEPLVLIDCAHILFPFARRVVSDVTRDGGFPPLQVEPINFAALYEQNKSNIQRGDTPPSDG